MQPTADVSILALREKGDLVTARGDDDTLDVSILALREKGD